MKMVRVHRKHDPPTGAHRLKHVVDPLRANMPVGERTGTDGPLIQAIRQRQTLQQVALKQMAIHVFATRLLQHVTRDVSAVYRTHAPVPQGNTTQARSGPNIKDRTKPTHQREVTRHFEGQNIATGAGKAVIIAVRPIRIQPHRIRRCFKRIGAAKVRITIHTAIKQTDAYLCKGLVSAVLNWHLWHMTKTLLSFGHGFSARALTRHLLPQGWRIIGTTRSTDKAAELADAGLEPLIFPGTDMTQAIARATHILISAGPDAEGDPVLREVGDLIRDHAPRLEWVGYLSTTGVYGDHQGGWVNEETALTPSTKRGQWRVAAEQAWQDIPDLPLHIFRLAGIYGPGRGPFAKVRNGTAQRIIKQDQVFSRIHVEDIAQVLAASINRPNAGAIYNLCDNDPAPPQDVIGHAATLLDLPLPPAQDFDTAEMSPMARSFYAENKRVSNDKIKTELGVDLLFPTYREGLAALLKDEQTSTAP